MSAPLLIAHRGLIKGPDKNRENSPRQINYALALGFDCEIDLWRVGGKLYLGHDRPAHHIDFLFLKTRGLWVHAKNIDALCFLAESQGINYFWHENDAYTLTSNNFIWTYPGNPLTRKSVSVMPEWHDAGFGNLDISCFGICSDFVLMIKEVLKASGG